MSVDRAIRDIRFPLLPDVEKDADEVLPNPDGRPWMKSCGECAFRTSDPQGLGDNYQRSLLAGTPGTLFYCVHTFEDDGTNRVCAAYAACHLTEANKDE